MGPFRLLRHSARVSGSHQFIEGCLILVCYPENLLFFGQGVALLEEDAMRATLPTVNCIPNSVLRATLRW